MGVRILRGGGSSYEGRRVTHDEKWEKVG